MKLYLASLALGALGSLGGALAQQTAGFSHYDLYVDARAPLGAWQVELVDESGHARVVGIEGGEHVAFQSPPRYDPRALTGGRIVLAAFQTESELPLGRTRVARVHVLADGAPRWSVRLIAAADGDGRVQHAVATLGD